MQIYEELKARGLIAQVTDEEEIRQGVRDAIDKNCKGGAYGFAGGVASRADDAEVAQKINLIVRDEAHWYGRKVYGYTGE